MLTMIRNFLLAAASSVVLFSCGQPEQKDLKTIIQNDERFAKVESMALDLVRGGFNAGDAYGEVWIRDYNTFIELSMEVMPDSLIRKNLNLFFAFQGEDGNIVDGFIPRVKADLDKEDGYKYRFSDLAPDYVAHKNTVETDHETSLIQAVAKYVRKSGNRAYLQEKVGELPVYERMAKAVDFLLHHKMDEKYALLTGATTVDWGDVQPEHFWGVEIDENTHYAIDIYDNAMFVLALGDLIEMAEDKTEKAKWEEVRTAVIKKINEFLWDEANRKFYPHIYLKDSPFPANFDENKIYYQGGTAVAALAGILSDEEIDYAYAKMKENQQAAHAQTIGLTVYPTYPAGYFKNVSMYPYGYQNGGDWTWFGARMVHALVKAGKIEQAYEALTPMLDRVIANNAFNEWYTPAGEPMGSGTFKGEAGVLYTAIQMLRNAVNEKQ